MSLYAKRLEAASSSGRRRRPARCRSRQHKGLTCSRASTTGTPTELAAAERGLIQEKSCRPGEIAERQHENSEARCGREVIISCGAVQSPGLLEHSGIGQPKLLKNFGIEVCHELKGAGENCGNHFTSLMSWRAKQATQMPFTALLHHIDEDALLRTFRRQKREASAAMGQRWRSTKRPHG
ncbi:GMC family oxidoreductase N-terminal domain-containing protein [Bradyrhizobium sp. CCBAU 11434]|uniref:GMC family oxidoreductase N-terminal domain-containing protein n=1 Tax=Bradyrhizobium sp. CCBAU 11434 TaxID=1630885 RepID=UPI0023058653|nr:GMC family oxidoreductase N-terminal domain-containing protein [Bradyrhizobium sp. CCBAU 11434]